MPMTGIVTGTINCSQEDITKGCTPMLTWAKKAGQSKQRIQNWPNEKLWAIITFFIESKSRYGYVFWSWASCLFELIGFAKRVVTLLWSKNRKGGRKPLLLWQRVMYFHIYKDSNAHNIIHTGYMPFIPPLLSFFLHDFLKIKQMFLVSLARLDMVCQHNNPSIDDNYAIVPTCWRSPGWASLPFFPQLKIHTHFHPFPSIQSIQCAPLDQYLKHTITTANWKHSYTTPHLLSSAQSSINPVQSTHNQHSSFFINPCD